MEMDRRAVLGSMGEKGTVGWTGYRVGMGRSCRRGRVTYRWVFGYLDLSTASQPTSSTITSTSRRFGRLRTSGAIVSESRDVPAPREIRHAIIIATRRVTFGEHGILTGDPRRVGATVHLDTLIPHFILHLML